MSSLRTILCVTLLLSAGALARSPGSLLSAGKPFGRFSLIDPFAPFDTLDHWLPFSRSATNFWNSALRPQHQSTPEITESDTSFYITIDTAGYTTEELKIHALGNEILIEGDHKCEQPGLCIARHFTKRYTVGRNVNIDAITTRRTPDGVLQLALPKADRRWIQVPVAEEPAALPEAATRAPDSPAQSATATTPLDEVTVEVE
eukprot:m.231023 g.231023  ORF g.231023 m.231023 type:complete len:203 (-) comp12152_c0_seq1:113-721(-)